MRESLLRLTDRITGQSKNPTPNQIRKYVENAKGHELSPEDFFNILPPEIVDLFLSRKGNIREEKIKKFYKSLEIIRDQYPDGDILKMSTNCIKKDGSIVIERLKEILENGPEVQ